MKFSDEAILAALLSNASVRRAAKSLNCSCETIRKRLKVPEFMQMYQKAKDEILLEACDLMKARLSAAVSTVMLIMASSESPPQVKLNAADSLLRNCLRYVETADILRRLAALENLTTEEASKP